MILVVCWFTATAMADDGIAQANRALAQDCPARCLDPIHFEVVPRGRK
jgi:hypothetical protein